MTVAVGTAAHGLTLEIETRLVKAAILYADSVILFSPAAVMLASAEQLGTLDDDQMMAFLRLVAPSVGKGEEIAEACAQFERLRAKRRRSKDDLQKVLAFEGILRGATRDLGSAAEALISDAGGQDLSIAIASGLVQIDPLVEAQGPPGVETTDNMAEAYLAKLASLLSDPSVHPLFDDDAGALVRDGVAKGLFSVSSGTARRATQAATAASLVERVPALPRATMAELLDVRTELHEPLTRFRRAVIKLAATVQSPFPDEDLNAAAADVYEAEVLPALDEIAEAFARDAFVRELLAVATEDVRDIITHGAGLALGALGVAHLPAFAAAAAGLGAGAASSVVKASGRVKEGRQRAEQNELYFLYATQQQLAAR